MDVRAYNLCGHTKSHTQNSPTLGLCLAVIVLKYLRILSSTLCFVSERQEYVCLLCLAPLFTYFLQDAPWTQNSSGPMMHGVQ